MIDKSERLPDAIEIEDLPEDVTQPSDAPLEQTQTTEEDLQPESGAALPGGKPGTRKLKVWPSG